MKLFIPACGDRIKLTKDWKFTLYLEYRNEKFAEARKLHLQNGKKIRGYGTWRGNDIKVEATLKKGTILECDRVYIRATNKARDNKDDDYDSITWKVIDPNKNKAKKDSRFWVKLSDCNNINYVIDSLYYDRVKIIRSVING